MMSHRFRAVIAGIPIAVLSTVLIASSGFAAESLRISTPLSGTTVSGAVLIEGNIEGGIAVDVDLGLAPQTLGDCGSPLVGIRVELASAAFATRIATTSVPDGTYCLIAVADAGRLSTVVADITVKNASDAGDSLEGLQLPTESIDGGGEDGAASSPVAGVLVGDVSLLGPLVLGFTGASALAVVGVGLWALRRTAR